MFKSVSASDQPASVSGQLAAKVRAEIAPVELPAAYAGKFHDCFFPKKGAPRTQFQFFGQHVARTQARLRIYFALLNHLMKISPDVQQAAALDQATGGTYASDVVASAVELYVKRLRAVADDTYWKPNYVNAALNAAMRNTSHATCLPTDAGFRITNVPLAADAVGYDWDVLTWAQDRTKNENSYRRGTGETVDVPSGCDRTFMSDGSSPSFDADPNMDDTTASDHLKLFYFGGFLSEFGQAVDKAMRESHKLMFGSVPSKAESGLKLLVLEIGDDKLQKLNTLLRKIPYLKSLTADFFPPADSRKYGAVTKFFKVGVRRCPLPTLGAAKIKAARQGNRLTLNAMPDFMIPYNCTTIHCGQVIDLPKDLVNHIVQGADPKITPLLLMRWFTAWSPSVNRIQGTKGAISQESLPETVSSATTLFKLDKMRQALGFKTSDSIGDVNGVTIGTDSRLRVLPRMQDIDVQEIAAHELEIATTLSKSYELGLSPSADGAAQRILESAMSEEDLRNDVISKQVESYTEVMGRNGNLVIGVDPMTGLTLMTDRTGMKVHADVEEGAVAAGALEVSDYLGYDFARPGDSPIVRTGGAALGSIMRNISGVDDASLVRIPQVVMQALQRDHGLRGDPSEYQLRGNGATLSDDTWHTIMKSDDLSMVLWAATAIGKVYGLLRDADLVPDLTVLKQEAAELQAAYSKEFGETEPTEFVDHGMYSAAIDNMPIDSYISYMGSAAYVDGSLVSRYESRLFNKVSEKLGGGKINRDDIEGDWRYCTPLTEGGLHGLNGMRGYLGGAIMIVAAKHVFKADRKKLFALMRTPAGKHLSARFLLNVTQPLAFLFSDAIPNRDKYFEQADAIRERNTPSTEPVSPEALAFSGSVDHSLMPHQADVQRTLYKPEPPEFALLDIAPGGGKTLLGLHDIIHCVQASPTPIRPFVIAPDNLVGNWCSDLHLVTHDWNVVPINSSSVQSWGVDRLERLITNAPINTIFVFGISFLANHNGKVVVDIGGARVEMLAQIEFLRRFNFGYGIMDESHKAKNLTVDGSSLTHRAIKQMFLQSSIKYKRLATGTLTPDRVHDVIGQAAMFSPAIFGLGKDLMDVARAGEDATVGDKFMAGVTKMQARLRGYVAYLDYKRKQWAFMLPTPVETFIVVDIADSSVAGSTVHYDAYLSIYQNVVDAIDAAKAVRAGDEDDEDDDDVEQGDDEDEQDTGSDSLGALRRNSPNLDIYYQRMEQMLTDPMGDPVARKLLEDAGHKDFIAVKVHKIVDRIVKHFAVAETFDASPAPVDPETGVKPDPNVAWQHQVFKWVAGCQPFEGDIAVADGVRYIARKKTEGDIRRYRLPVSNVHPKDDLEYWKPEAQGKVIVYCQYDRSGNAVRDALKVLAPELWKKSARLIASHGTVSDLIERFKTDNSLQILVANEKAIAEGHNLQVGSRVIRCDTGWSPGLVDQSHARVMRPDFNAVVFDENGMPGDLKRSQIFIDWVMTNHTMEVAKVAKVIGKQVRTTLYSEESNPRYEPLRKWANLLHIPYNSSVLTDPQWTDINTYKDPEIESCQHLIAKAYLNHTDAHEFAEMRQTTAAELVKVSGKTLDPALGYKIIEQVPFTANQDVYDRWGYDLIPFKVWYKEESAKKPFTNNRGEYGMRIVGLPVLTEWGNGVIQGITKINTALFEDDTRRNLSPTFTSLNIEYPDGTVMIVKTSKVFVAGAALSDPAVMAQFKGKKAKANATPTREERERNRKQGEKDSAATDRSRDRIRDTDKKVDSSAAASSANKQDAEKRGRNKKEGKDANADIPPIKDNTDTKVPADNLIKPVRVPRKQPEPDAVDKVITVNPVVYNGLLALYVDATDADYKDLVKVHEFAKFGEYVYCDSKYLKDFYAQLDMLEAKFDFDKATVKRLTDIQQVFASTGRQLFTYPYAYKTRSEIVEFFRTRHRDNADKKMLKVYPCFMMDRMRVMIDLNTNLHAAQLVGKAVPNAQNTKLSTWKKHPAMAVNLCGTVTSAKSVLQKLVKAGYKITNLKDLQDQLKDIRIRPDADQKK